MAKANNKQLKIAKLVNEKARIVKREKMIKELRSHAIDKMTQSKLRSVVTSNKRTRKYKDSH